MKIKITELRDIVAETVSRVLAEAPKKGSKRPPKDIPQKSEDAVLAQRDRHVRGMPGYKHSDENDFSRPLGAANIVKKQGASSMGGWTSESTTIGDIRKRIGEMQIRRLVRIIVREEVRANRGKR